MRLKTQFKKAKWRAGVVRDALNNLTDGYSRHITGLVEGRTAEQRQADSGFFTARIAARKAARRVNKPA